MIEAPPARMAQDRQFSWRRSVAWALSLAVHIAVALVMLLPREPVVVESEVDRAPTLDWVPVGIDPLPRTGLPTEPLMIRQEDAAVLEVGESPTTSRSAPSVAFPPRAVPATLPARPDVSPGSSSAPTVVAALPIPRAIVYLDDRARALLPHEELYSASPPPREGDYYTPGNGSEDDVFYRPRALDPNPSRFAHAWQPRGNLIDGWLGALLDKATGEVSIPLNPKFNLVCKTVAGVSGSCAIVRNAGSGVIVQRPPPAPWDRSSRVQCRELREAIDAAEEAAELAYYLDRLSALCREEGGTEGVVPAGGGAVEDGVGNGEARREAGLQEDGGTSSDATGAQRAL